MTIVYKGFDTPHEGGLILKSDTNTFEAGSTSKTEAMILAMDPMGVNISYMIKDGKFLLFEIRAGGFAEVMSKTIYLYQYYVYDGDDAKKKQNNLMIMDIGDHGYLELTTTWNDFESEIEVTLYDNESLKDLDAAALYEESKASRTVVNDKFMKMIYGNDSSNNNNSYWDYW